MTFLDKILSRDRAPSETQSGEAKEPQERVIQDSDSSDLSLFARNEKEVEQNPDKVTQDAHIGVQKAEAAAMVWSKKVVYATYGW
jgi:hypothetical protein